MKNWIKDHFEEHLQLLKTLSAIPAPSHREDERVAFLLGWLKEHGFERAYSDEAKNVIVPFFGEEDGAISFYSAHTDVVFPDETPLLVREEGGRLCAPGVGDDTANAAAMLTMLLYIKERRPVQTSPFAFVFNSCEEGLGNLKGIRQIMKDFGGRVKQLVSFDCSFEEGMVVRAVGSERWRVTASTRGGHSYMDFGSPNAIERMAALVGRLYAQPVPAAENSRATYNVGTISGGTSINTIAQSCEMLYEYRSDDRACLEALRESFKKLLGEAGSDEARFEAELIGERPCGGNVDEKALEALFGRCEAAIVRVTGEKPKRFSASTDANIPLSLGIPAVTFGLFSGEGAHTREEWLDISSLAAGLEIGLTLLLAENFACNQKADSL